MKHETEQKKENTKIVLRKNGTKRVSIVSFSPSKTDPSQAKETDVNEIVRRFKKQNAQQFHRWFQQPVNAPEVDLTGVTDLLGAYEAVRNAEQAFSALPAAVRDKFANSPLELEAWLQDEKNNDEAIELGLKIPKPQKPSSKQTTASEEAVVKPSEPTSDEKIQNKKTKSE